MGVFNFVKFSTKCPKCGELITDFQTKDGDLTLRTVDFFEVDNFYSSCDKCNTVIEYTLQPELRKLISIQCYNLEIK